jgi:phage host-nuclease inhibitor protein Gam
LNIPRFIVYAAIVQEPVQERIRNLRQEIAEISAANQVHLQQAGKTYTAAAEHERRLQRLQAILDELSTLTDWKKT